MKVGLCAMYAEQWIAGILYLQSIAETLQALPSPDRPEISVLLPEHARSPHSEALRPLARHLEYFHSSGKNGWWRSFLPGQHPTLAGLARKRGIDIIYPLQETPREPLPVPWIGWIPDFQHKRLPECFSPSDIAERDARFQSLIRHSRHLVVSSQDALNDLHEFYQVPPDKVSVYPFCIQPRIPSETETARTAPGDPTDASALPRKFLYFPSQFWKHKNHFCLLRAMALLRKQGLNDVHLVLTGKANDYRFPQHADEIRAFITAHGLEHHVHERGFLPRNQQVVLLRNAAAIVQPSLFEGWSMLVEECRAWGKPLYLSDIPVHREQSPSRATFFNANSPEELAGLIAQDWPSLTPGPDPVAESEAALAINRIQAERSRSLLHILRQAC